MALQSQAPRAAASRRYTTTNRRKKGLAPWLVLLGLAVIIGGLIVLFTGGPDPATLPDDPTGESATAGAIPSGTGTGTATASAGPGTPAPADPAATNNNTATPPVRDVQQNPTQHNANPLEQFNATPLTGEAKDQFEIGMQRLEAGDVVSGRALLSELLFRDGALPRHEAQAVRERLAFLNEKLVFSKSSRTAEQIKRDPIVDIHRVQSGEYLSTIANTYRTPYQFIERVNSIDARRLQAGQAIQVLLGPVHARIDKSDYRMDLYVLDPAGLPIYLKSYTVGLGEFDSTPIGTWRIKPGSKVGPANGGPSWRNPRTGQVYDRNDPDIPIGEYWMALEGMDENTKGKAGYGIHATNDQESIGRQESMGCIRMRDADVDQVFYTLFEGASNVEITP